ncbi:uncharacterized [Tachysurus ichikawai]
MKPDSYNNAINLVSKLTAESLASMVTKNILSGALISSCGTLTGFERRRKTERKFSLGDEEVKPHNGMLGVSHQISDDKQSSSGSFCVYIHPDSTWVCLCKRL